MIDVPIGLPEWRYRRCDLEARELVGSSVFLGARWNVWTFRSYKDANAYYWEHGDTGIAKQLWCIRDKLQEVNEAMTPRRQSRLQETHPELVLWRLNGGPLANKKIEDGRKQRIALLKRHGFDQIETWLGQRRGTGTGRDDLIDACTCALAARDRTQRIQATCGIGIGEGFGWRYGTDHCFDAFSRARQGFKIRYLEVTHSRSRLIRLLLSRIMRDQRSCAV
jgi:predicted RNase H-like nuclease